MGAGGSRRDQCDGREEAVADLPPVRTTLEDYESVLREIKNLDQASEGGIVELNIPTGVPLVYELDDKLKPLNRYYLGDPEKVKAAMRFAGKTGKRAAIGSLDDITAIVAGEAGTNVVA